jgi:hypothetical protein
MHGFRRCRPQARAAAALLTALALTGVSTLGQAPPADPEEAAVERHLLSTAQAFRDKDVPGIRKAFAENFAGPLRLPRLARSVLDQVMGAAQTVSADLAIKESHIGGPRALVIADLTLSFEFGGDGKEFKGPYLFWLDKGNAGWTITGAEAMATDWTVPEQSTEVHWPDEGLRFAVPTGWGIFPLASPEAKRSVECVAPDLSVSFAVATLVLPVPMQLKTIAANHHGIATIYPGSRFIDEAETTVAGQPAVLTHMELAMGSRPSWVETIMTLRDTRLTVVTRSVTPATATARFDAEFSALRNSIVLAAAPAAEAGTSPPAPAKGFTNQRLGVGFPTPDGWILQALDEDTTRRQGWAFGAHLRPAQGEGDSTILFGAKELPGPIDLKTLQEQEMKNVSAVADGVVAEDVRDLQVSGLPARSWSYTLALGQERRRREVFITRSNVLFFIIADAIPPTAFAGVSKAVDSMLETLSLAKP